MKLYTLVWTEHSGHGFYQCSQEFNTLDRAKQHAQELIHRGVGRVLLGEVIGILTAVPSWEISPRNASET